MSAYSLWKRGEPPAVKFCVRGQGQSCRYLFFLVLLLVFASVSPAWADDWLVQVSTNPGSFGIDTAGNSYLDGYWSMYKYDTDGVAVWEKPWSTLLADVLNGNNSTFRWSYFCRDGSFFTAVQLQDAGWNDVGVTLVGFDADGSRTSFLVQGLPNVNEGYPGVAAAFPGRVSGDTVVDTGIAVATENIITKDITYADPYGTTTENVTYTPSVTLTRYNGSTGTPLFSVQLSTDQLGGVRSGRTYEDIEVQALAVSPDQSAIYIAGTLKDPISMWTSRYPQNIFVAKIDAADGSLVWSRRDGPDQWPSGTGYWVPFEVTSLAVDSGNMIHVTAKDWHYQTYIVREDLYLRLDSDNNVQAREEPSSIGREKLVAGEDGFVYGLGLGSAADRAGDTSLGDTGGYIVKYDPAGSALAVVSVAPLGRSGDAQPYGAVIDAAGTSYVWGYNFGSNMAFIQKNPQINPLKVNVYDGLSGRNLYTGMGDTYAPKNVNVLRVKLETSVDDFTIDSLTVTSRGNGDEVNDLAAVRLRFPDYSSHDATSIIPGKGTTPAKIIFANINRTITGGTTEDWDVEYDFSADACAWSDGYTLGTTYVAQLPPSVVLDGLEAVRVTSASEGQIVRVIPNEGPEFIIKTGVFSKETTTDNQGAEKETNLPRPFVTKVSQQSVAASCGVKVVFSVNSKPAGAGSESLSPADPVIPSTTTNEASSQFLLGDKSGVYNVDAEMNVPLRETHGGVVLPPGSSGGHYGTVPGGGGTPKLYGSMPKYVMVARQSFTANAYGVDISGATHNGSSLPAIGTFITNISPAVNVFNATALPDPLASGGTINFQLNPAGVNPLTTPGTASANGVFKSGNFDMSSLMPGDNVLQVTVNTGTASYTDSATIRALDFPSWIQPLTAMSSSITTEFLDTAEKYHVGFSYPVDFAWNNTIAGSILLLGGKKNSANLSFNVDAFYHINETASLSGKGALSSTVLGWDFDANGELSGNFDKNFSLIEGRGSLHTTLPFSIPEKGVSKTVIVYGVPVTVALDVGGSGKVLLAGSAVLGSNLEFKKVLIHPGLEVELDATASVAAFYGAAKLGVNAKPLTEIELKLLYVSVVGITPSFGGRITIPIRVIGSLFWGAVSGTLGSTTLGPYGFGTMASSSSVSYPYALPMAAGANEAAIPEFIVGGDIAVSGQNIMLIMTADTDAAEGSISPDVFYRYFDGTGWQAMSPVATEADLWEMDPALTFLGNSNALALWTSNDGAKTLTDLNDIFAHQDIRYAVWNGTSWSTPAWLTDDLETDGMADVSYNAVNEEAIAVWFHDANSDGDQESRDEWEIYAAIYDGATAAWDTAAPISGSDGEADYMPRVASGGSHSMAVWARDTDGSFITVLAQVTDGTNVSYDNTDGSVYYALYENSQWSAADMIPGSEKGFVSFPAVGITADGSKALIVWMIKENGSTAGSVQSSLYYAIYTFADSSWTTPAVLRAGSGMEDVQVVTGSGTVATVLWRTTGPVGNGHVSQTTVDLSTGTIGAMSQVTYGPQADWGLSAAMAADGTVHGMWQPVGGDNVAAPAAGSQGTMQSGVLNVHNGVINSVVGEEVVDRDNDGLMDILRINVDLDISRDGDFTLIGILVDSNGQQVAAGSTAMAGITAGNHIIGLDFDGKAISAHNVDGPYTVSKIILLEDSNGSLLADMWDTGWLTAAHKVGDFAPGFVGVLRGDVDGDLEITLSDAIVSQQILSSAAGLSALRVRPYYAKSGTDVNGDGKVGSAEAIYVLQELAGMRGGAGAAVQ